MHKFTGAKPPRSHHRPSLLTHGKSQQEIDVLQALHWMLSDVTIVSGDRGILGNGQEVDIAIPEFKLGIEYDGLKFHTDANGKTDKYHLTKSILAEQRGWRLIHIFSDEWEQKPQQVTSLLRNAIGRGLKIDANTTEILPITRTEAIRFNNNSSILPFPEEADMYLGLFVKSTLICSIVIKKDSDVYTILRIQDGLNILTINILDKILDYLPKDIQLYSEIDRRTEYNFYTEWEELTSTKPTVYYTKDYKHRLTEIQLKESKIPQDQYHKIWDCGKRLFKYKRT